MTRTFAFAIAAVIAAAQPAWAQGAAAAQASTPAPAAHTQALAEALVEASDEREHFTKGLEGVENLLVRAIASNLSMTDAPTAAKVTAIVHDRLSPASAKVVDAMVGAYAANFSDQELREIMAYVRGPGGRAHAANIPLLKGDLEAIFTETEGSAKIEDQGERSFENASPARRALILRIFKAQNLEANTRKAYASIGKIFAAAAATTIGRGHAETKPESKGAVEKDAHGADDYVRLVMAVEKHFYVDHFTDAELTATADYLESEVGRAALSRRGLVQGAAAQAMQDQLMAVLPTLTEAVCSAVTCSLEQRASLAKTIAAMEAVIPTVKSAVS